VNKTCPANPDANDYWYFYEDSGKLLGEGKTVSTENDKARYGSIKDYSERAYITVFELKHFNWDRIRYLNLAPKGSDTSTGNGSVAELLPPDDFVDSLLTQSAKCNALAIRVWEENPFAETDAAGKYDDPMAITEWWALYYRFEWEISKAQSLIATLEPSANRMFNEAEMYLSNAVTEPNPRYVNELRRTHAMYIDRLEQVSLYLEQAREAGWKMKCHMLSSPPRD